MSRPIPNVIGFDDAPFPREHRGDVRLVGVVPKKSGSLSFVSAAMVQFPPIEALTLRYFSGSMFFALSFAISRCES